MQESNHFIYATKIWLTSAFVAPILIGLFMAISEPMIEGLFIIPFLMGFGLLFSIPNWFIFTISIWLVNKLNLLILEKKVIITFIAFFLTLGLFLLIFSGDSDLYELLGLSIAYHITLTFGIWYFELIPPIDFTTQSPISQKIKVLEDILDDEKY